MLSLNLSSFAKTTGFGTLLQNSFGSHQCSCTVVFVFGFGNLDNMDLTNVLVGHKVNQSV